MLSTHHKMAIARAFNRAILCMRRIAGRGSEVEVTRRGIRWHLDLNEGIDLALYLNLYQSLPRRVLDRWIRPASFVVDVGANIGAISLQMARNLSPEAHVVSVEPTDFAYNKLVANVKLNPDLAVRVIPVQAAMSDGSTPIVHEFYSRWPLNDDGTPRHGKHEGKFEVADKARFVPLDKLLDELRASGQVNGRVSFVKLDVDGYELSVLKGATRMLTADRPPILIEIAPHVQDEVPGRFEDLIALLGENGYYLENAATGAPLPNDVAGLRAHIRDGASLDALAQPR